MTIIEFLGTSAKRCGQHGVFLGRSFVTHAYAMHCTMWYILKHGCLSVRPSVCLSHFKYCIETHKPS